MKRLLLILLVFVPVLVISQEIKWNLIVNAKNGSLFYIRNENIVKNTTDIKVWVKIVYSKSEISEILQTMSSNKNRLEVWSNTSYSLKLYEFNTIENKFRVLTSCLYDKDGKMIDADFIVGDWWYVIPETNIDILYRRILKM